MKTLSYVGNAGGLMEYLKKVEVKCETCGVGLDRTIKYGRNICDRCEEHLLFG